MNTMKEWLNYIDSLHGQNIDMGLERIKAVAEKMNVLKPAPFVFLVGGTNGKGTTCHTLEMTLLKCGYKVGVYSSPVIEEYNESVRIQNKQLDDASFVQAFKYIDQIRGDISLTPFEFNTLAAFFLIQKNQSDVAIIEVGMGGATDATNIIDVDISILTNVALDHVDWLGQNRDEIGKTKAGIFRENKIALVGDQNPPESVINYIQEIQAKGLIRNKDWIIQNKNETSWSLSIQGNTYATDLPIPLMPLENTALALVALKESQLNFKLDVFKQVLIEDNLPGRFQVINRPNEATVILDVAHNPASADYLRKKLEAFPKTGKYIFVVGLLKNKDIEGVIQLTQTLSDQWYCAGLEDGPRSSNVKDISKYLANAHEYAHIKDAWQAADVSADPSDVIVVFGSFKAVSPVLQQL